MKTRIIISILVVALFAFANHLLELVYSTPKGTLTAATLNDSINSYALAKVVRDGDLAKFRSMCIALILALVWITPLCNLIRRKRSAAATAVMMLFGALMTSCVGPYKT